MADLDVEMLATHLTNEAFRICRERGLRLTDQAVRFLRLAAEALIKEPPVSSNPRFPADEYGPGSERWLEIGQVILGTALGSSRVDREMAEREVVSFPTLLRAVAGAGHRELSRMGYKD